MSLGRQYDAYGRLTRRHDRADLPIDSTTAFHLAESPAPFDEHLAYSLETPGAVVSTVESTYPGHVEDAQFTHNANFDLTQDIGWEHEYTTVGRTVGRDAAGRIQTIHSDFHTTPSSTTPAFDETVTWDPANQRQVKQLVGGAGIQDITYDVRGLVAGVALSYAYVNPDTAATETTTEGTFAYDTYDAVGRNTHLVYPDGHTRSQTWDALGRLTSRCYNYGATAPERCYTASYDEVGNPTTLTDPERTCTLTYDALDRIESVVCTDGDTESYTYNALGALTTNADVTLDTTRPRLDGAGTAASGLPATYAGQPVALDPMGRITTLGTTTLTWNARGRLVEAADGTVDEQYGHDSYLRRISRKHADTSGTTQEFYIYDAPPSDAFPETAGVLPSLGNISAVLQSPGVAGIQRRILYDGIDHPLWMYDAAQHTTIYFELDTLGNVRRLRGGRRLGTMGTALPSDLGGYKYTAFGKLLPADAATPAPELPDYQTGVAAGFEQPLRWQGRWYSALAGGVYDVRARQWSPELGAFLSPDEMQFLTGTGTLWSWPGENPIGQIDPRGRWGFAIGPEGGLGVSDLVEPGLAGWLGFGVYYDSARGWGGYFSGAGGVGIGLFGGLGVKATFWKSSFGAFEGTSVGVGGEGGLGGKASGSLQGNLSGPSISGGGGLGTGAWAGAFVSHTVCY